MDRRQRKTREAIFNAFTQLLAQKNFSKITVGEIIEHADIGRATFYSHFETKDLLLKEYCKELFCHIFDTATNTEEHKHIFDCDGSDPVFLHLFRHLRNNDNNILKLLSSRNNELFLEYFKTELGVLMESRVIFPQLQNNKGLPESFWKNHILSTFIECIKWWIANGMKEPPEVITDYFMRLV